MVEYKCVSFKDAAEEGYPGADEYCYDLYDDGGWGMGIWRFENDVPVQLLAGDGGEPEDNSFRRDGSWITPALNAAYKKGFEDGLANEN